jgi:hypothetical protein
MQQNLMQHSHVQMHDAALTCPDARTPILLTGHVTRAPCCCCCNMFSTHCSRCCPFSRQPQRLNNHFHTPLGPQANYVPSVAVGLTTPWALQFKPHSFVSLCHTSKLLVRNAKRCSQENAALVRDAERCSLKKAEAVRNAEQYSHILAELQRNAERGSQKTPCRDG